MAALVALFLFQAVLQTTAHGVPEQTDAPAEPADEPTDAPSDAPEEAEPTDAPQQGGHQPGGPEHGRPEHEGKPQRGEPQQGRPRDPVHVKVQGPKVELRGGLGIDLRNPLSGGKPQGSGAQTQANVQIIITAQLDLSRLIKNCGESLSAGARIAILAAGGGRGTANILQISASLSAAGIVGFEYDYIIKISCKLSIEVSGIGKLSLKKTGQAAVESVKKLIKLAVGILIDFLKQLAGFLKTYMPQISDTCVKVLGGLLPSVVDSLNGCTSPILQLIGMLIAECPGAPVVNNSTRNATQEGPGGSGWPVLPGGRGGHGPVVAPPQWGGPKPGGDPVIGAGSPVSE